MLSYNKTAMGIVCTAITRAGAELGSANPPLVFGMAVGQGISRSVGFSWTPRIVVSMSSRPLSCYSTSQGSHCVMGLPVSNPHGTWLDCQEAPAETKLKCLSIHQCFTTDNKSSKCILQYRAFTWKLVFKRMYPYFCRIHVC